MTIKVMEGKQALGELKEFATFSKGCQRYVRRSLDVGAAKCDPLRRWSRNEAEASSIRAQVRVYSRLDELRSMIPDTSGLDEMEPFMAPLLTMTAFDLGETKLEGFGSYRFLYERLLGPTARPWLPAAFCAAAALPHIHPDRRRRLLQSISEAAATAAGWSSRRPSFYPEWVEKVDLSEAA